MICLETEYFVISKPLLKAIGLWPYQQSALIWFQVILFSGILATVIIFQLTTFVTSKCTTNFVIKILSNAFFFLTLLTKYTSFRLHINVIKDLLTQLQDTCNQITEPNEIAIIRKYGYNARRYTSIFRTFFLSTVPITIIGQVLPNIFHSVLSNNESRPHNLQITMEYFIDQQKYFYFILFHLNTAICIGIITTAAVGSTFIAYFQYACGMFMIASFRIENAMENNKLQDINNKHFILIGLSRAVEMHRQAVKLCDLLICRFETMYFCLIVFGVICLSLNLLQIFQTKESGEIQEFVLSIVLVAVCGFYMFVANLVGQDITDHNDEIYVTVYNVQWYKAPLHIQKIILFLLQRGVKSFTLTIGGLFDASFECFATLVKASVSYFTVLYSTR
ncbi:hypothetical protein DMN91_005863 [Ooceraea biroi]|uniref:Odorant receptor n=1 Tax=Ooceraea biroi TaxID=2015173 RepID=A0A026VVV8_OOCBI|nr:uncharacterized protein LOC105286933 [Ooceraea biroi]EZA46969.1 hypothetical protein X777_16822 [Ooceraea biroi]RLU21490.1 hypothetical protein DMN91_005863 [Ooceraea biroi]